MVRLVPLGNHREELFGAEPGSDYVLHWDAFCENSRNYRDMHRDKFLAGYNLLEEHGLRKVGSATGKRFPVHCDFSSYTGKTMLYKGLSS